MRSDEATVTLYVADTAERLAEACHESAKHWWGRCPAGMHFHCPLAVLGEGRCAKVEAKDWEAIMTFGEEDDE